MAATSTPYGFRPVRMLGGQSNSASTSTYRIASGQATNIFNGMPVALNASGVIVPATAGFAGLIGVFQGCAYTDPVAGYITRQFWPSGTVASDAVAYVADDPDQMWMAQCSVANFDALANVGRRLTANLPAAPNDGRTTTGNSIQGVTATVAAGTGEFVLLGIAQLPDNVNASGFVDLIGTFPSEFYVTRAP